IIEMMRQRELLREPGAPQPTNPREAVQRYFKLPPLDQLPRAQPQARQQARELARSLLLLLEYDKTQQVLPTKDKKPTDTYLEDNKRGKECCVFLINGQRQDAWDNTFIVRDLG